MDPTDRALAGMVNPLISHDVVFGWLDEYGMMHM